MERASELHGHAVRRSGRTVSVNYATADGTASAPGDYFSISTTTLTFNPGETTKPITVQVRATLWTKPTRPSLSISPTHQCDHYHRHRNRHHH